jgi:hypothetical protein
MADRDTKVERAREALREKEEEDRVEAEREEREETPPDEIPPEETPPDPPSRPSSPSRRPAA